MMRQCLCSDTHIEWTETANYKFCTTVGCEKTCIYGQLRPSVSISQVRTSLNFQHLFSSFLKLSQGKLTQSLHLDDVLMTLREVDIHENCIFSYTITKEGHKLGYKAPPIGSITRIFDQIVTSLYVINGRNISKTQYNLFVSRLNNTFSCIFVQDLIHVIRNYINLTL